VKSGWKIVDEVQGRFCKKAVRSPKSTASGAAKLERGVAN
jgi:hypothetical protein